jgi:N-acetylmuramoyl-L-alanine amidase
MDEEAKRLAELKVKRAGIEARLAKLDEPRVAKTEKSESSSENATGILFKIQIHTATKLLERSASLFQGLNPEQYEQDGLYKYTVGNFNTSDEAGEMQADMRDRGFKGAFIVAFRNGERLKVSIARKLTENNGN